MIQRRKLCLTIALAVLLGCAGGEATKAQEKPGAPDAKPDEKADTKPGNKTEKTDKEKAEDKHVYTAKVTDRAPEAGQKDYEIARAEVWVPEVSLLGGEGHTAEKKLLVKRGAAEIEVPFTQIAWIGFGELKEDRLVVDVHFAADMKSDDAKVRERSLKGTIKSNLLLHGTYETTNLEAKLKLREVAKIELKVQEEK